MVRLRKVRHCLTTGLYVASILFLLLFVPVCSMKVYINRELVRFTRVLPKMTQQEVLQVVGTPKHIYSADQLNLVYTSYEPKPRIQPEGDMWVYDVLMHRVVIHFDMNGKVQYVVFTKT
jgi:hypothetical protein